MKFRRHHNNKGYRTIRGEKLHNQAKQLERELVIQGRKSMDEEAGEILREAITLARVKDSDSAIRRIEEALTTARQEAYKKGRRDVLESSELMRAVYCRPASLADAEDELRNLQEHFYAFDKLRNEGTEK